MADKKSRNRKDFSQTMHGVVEQAAARSERGDAPLVTEGKTVLRLGIAMEKITPDSASLRPST
jgi:hypothetical protein